MSRRVISDATARQLIGKLNRRTGAISVLRRDPQSSSWRAILLQTVMSMLPISLLALSGRRWESWVISICIFALWSLVEVYNTGLNRRIDALVELLQQGGMLDTKLPPDSAQED